MVERELDIDHPLLLAALPLPPGGTREGLPKELAPDRAVLGVFGPLSALDAARAAARVGGGS